VKALIHTARERRALGVLKPWKRPTTGRSTCWWTRWCALRRGPEPGRSFALWGLAFKPNTDDMREAPSRVMVAELSAPRRHAVRPTTRWPWTRPARAGRPAGLSLRRQRLDAALEGADALLIVTEWKEFRTPDFDAIKATLKQPVIFDGRNLYEPALMKSSIQRSGAG
jgi:UDPglucose 6-dehydrogenase